MNGDRCRVCGNAFFPRPLLTYENMPGTAQYLPDASALESDRGVDLVLCQCGGCGLVQLSGEPVAYYREVIRASAVSPEMTEFRRGQFEDFIARHSLHGKKVIEIGCGKGEFLAILQGLGVRAHGLESARASVDHCRRQGMRVVQGFVETADDAIADAPFDAFFMLNFLEHLPDPNATLRGVCNNLAPGAVGLVEVPNFDMMLRSRLFSEFMTDHLLYFTLETLQSTLCLNGFEVIGSSAVWHDYILSAAVRKRKQLDMSGFLAHQEKVKREIQAYVAGFGEKRVAVWGAGHQALAILALNAPLTRAVRYVVDSAAFKQGKYTTATHVPIVSPDTLRTDPVDAVIVMAASYSDEVVRIVRETYDGIAHVSVLRDHGLEVR